MDGLAARLVRVPVFLRTRSFDGDRLSLAQREGRQKDFHAARPAQHHDRADGHQHVGTARHQYLYGRRGQLVGQRLVGSFLPALPRHDLLDDLVWTGQLQPDPQGIRLALHDWIFHPQCPSGKQAGGYGGSVQIDRQDQSAFVGNGWLGCAWPVVVVDAAQAVLEACSARVFDPPKMGPVAPDRTYAKPQEQAANYANFQELS